MYLFHGFTDVDTEMNIIWIVQDKELQTDNTKSSDINLIEHIPLYLKTQQKVMGLLVKMCYRL
jgi:hypothetical protein